MSGLLLCPCRSAGDRILSKVAAPLKAPSLHDALLPDAWNGSLPLGCTSPGSLHDAPNLYPIIITPFLKSLSKHAHLTVPFIPSWDPMC